MSRENNETRQKVLQATVDALTASGGGDGVRMSDIAKIAGVSRQAVYLHFASRTELLVAATRFLDEKLDLEGRLRVVREAGSGKDRLIRYVHFWAEYIPNIYGVASALMVARTTDEAAHAAWDDRMSALRSGCEAAVAACLEENILAPEWDLETATDVFWSMLLVPIWENLTLKCGWTTELYKERISVMVVTALLK